MEHFCVYKFPSAILTFNGIGFDIISGVPSK